jgi:S1-C subfamily serine protease
MHGSKNLVDRRFLTAGVALLAISGRAYADPPELKGTSPSERAAIINYCGDSRGSIARGMCMANQVENMLRLGRKPDLSVATPAQRNQITESCAGNSQPAARFACEREALRAAGLPIRDEQGAGQITAETSAGLTKMESPITPRVARRSEFPFFDVEQWRSERPSMPSARGGDALPPAILYQKISPSIYIVVASDHAVELAERTPHAQGSAVAITDRILVTNCHVVAGRPQIRISQREQVDRASVIYADPGGDRCFLKSETMTLNPVQGVRRFDDLHVGEPVFSIGAPVGLEQSYGQGIISGLRDFEGVDMVQNSAPSWHGSSGGGLFDARGNLVGITTAISATAPNLNFSIAAQDFWF